MSATQATDFSFVPKVWNDHIEGFFRTNLGWASLGALDRTLVAQPGTTIHFPYFGLIGAVEEPTETDVLGVDKLTDDSFEATVKEIGKAVGFKTAAYMKSAESKNEIHNEVSRQIARRVAEKVQADIITEMNTVGNYVEGFAASDAGHVATVARILQGLVTAFGDRHKEAFALVMHSQAFLSMMTDSTAGFLKADANDPFYSMPGFEGRLLGKALFIDDSCPAGAAVGGKGTYQLFAVKPKPFGIMMKQDMMLETDKDILARETIIAATQWYAVKSFHAKASADDKRVARMTFTIL